MTTTAADTLVMRNIDSPVGPLTIAASPAGVRLLIWEGHDDALAAEHAAAATMADTPATRNAEQILERTIAQLGEYFAGSRTEFDLPLDPRGTAFQQSAWMVLRTIPYGQTMSYGQQARALGDPNKARAVGGANGKNPISIIVPCHRVVGADGSLTGFGGGIDVKAWLLDHERQVLAHH